MFSIRNWFNEMLVKRVVGLLSRRVLDIVSGALLSTVCFGTDVCSSFAEWIQSQATSIEAFIVAAVLAGISVVWSFKQKKTDLKAVEIAEAKRV